MRPDQRRELVWSVVVVGVFVASGVVVGRSLPGWLVSVCWWVAAVSWTVMAAAFAANWWSERRGRP